MSQENLFTPYANKKGVDQPARPRSLISTFAIRCLDSIRAVPLAFRMCCFYFSAVLIVGVPLPFGV